MKAMQFVTYFFLFNAFLYIFTSIGIYSISMTEPTEGWVDLGEGKGLIETALEMAGVGAVAATFTGIASYYLAGVTGLQAMSLAVLLGFFVSLFYNTYGVMQNISASLGEFAFVLNTFFILTGSVFVISLIYAVAQMGMGGGRAYE